MSKIIKTEAIVLSKLNYGETSSIVSLFTKEYGKLSAMLKGGRNPKSKISLIVDPINYLEVIFYNNPSRDLQILSSADFKSNFHKIKEDLDKLKYAHSVIELVKNLSVEHEANKKLFIGIIRILGLINEGKENPGITFGRFFLFFLKELGYEFQSDINNNENITINSELFLYLNCLKKNESAGNVSPAIINGAITFFENYLRFHVSDFKGLQSLNMFKEKY
ncbi:MAG: DNA repair protein RecO [Ignavibacteriaceae bacterium]|nr:DNA repair protein RecO [Ignavibacteriaceae bacterium]